MTPTSPRPIILIQVRRLDDPVREHERACFSRALHGAAFDVIELLADDARDRLAALVRDPSPLVLIGGSGDFSVTQGGPPPLLEFVSEVVPKLIARDGPLLGICWGLHALVAGAGGRLARPGHGEVGTFDVSLTTQGRDDPLFRAPFPNHFKAQLGHRDWVVALPEGWVSLCENAATRFQATRLVGSSVYGVQFHPELDRETNLWRFRHYSNYYAPEEADRLLESFAPSPEASALIARFIDLFGEE